jgi:hypothetical protein
MGAAAEVTAVCIEGDIEVYKERRHKLEATSERAK